jgi:hypothetical protein
MVLLPGREDVIVPDQVSYRCGRPRAEDQVNVISAVCSDVQAQEACNNDYDDHDADDVKNVHGTLRLRD